MGPMRAGLDFGRRRSVALLALAAALALLAVAALAPSDAAAKTKWLCKPGERPNPCKGSLKTTRFAVDGSATILQPPRARRPGYDCFYVYPTVSRDNGLNSDLNMSEEIGAVAAQAARFSSVCKVYAPKYRQMTVGADRFGFRRLKR